MADGQAVYPQDRPNLPILLLMTVAMATATAAICRLAQLHTFPSPTVILMLAVLLGQVSILGLFLGLGTANGMVRLASVAAGTMLWVTVHRFAKLPVGGELTTILAVQAIVVGLVAYALRSTGVYWTSHQRLSHSPSALQLDSRQFTIAQLMGWTTVAAVIAALARQATFPATGPAFFLLALVLGANVVIAFAAAWVASGARHFLHRMAFLVALAMGLGWAVGGMSQQIEPGLFGALNVLQALVVAGWIGAGRAAGVRIGRCVGVISDSVAAGPDERPCVAQNIP
jgi:hypothetical protein